MQQVFNKVAVAEKTCSPLYSFQSTSKDRQRDQLVYYSVTAQGRRVFGKDIHVRTQPARNSQAPGGTGVEAGSAQSLLSPPSFVLISLEFCSTASWDSGCLCCMSGIGPKMANSVQSPGVRDHHFQFPTTSRCPGNASGGPGWALSRWAP